MDVEHIIPDSLGCPPDFVLGGGLVCKSCNNGLSHLDHALSGAFNFNTFMAGVPRKKNRSPVIETRGNVVGGFGKNGPEIFINMERHSVQTSTGKRLGAFGKSPQNIDASFKIEGDKATINFQVKIGDNPKFIRAIVKVAFGSLVFFKGDKEALLDKYDAVRDFVRFGKGQRQILFGEGAGLPFQNFAAPPYEPIPGEFAAAFRIAMLEFVVDLTPDMCLVQMYAERLRAQYGAEGWGRLPV